MRLLFVHSEYFEFEARTTAVPDDVAETEGVAMDGRSENCLTIFVTVEADDQRDVSAVVGNTLGEIEDVSDQLNTSNVILYPYAHLSDDRAEPDAAKRVLVGLEDILTERGYEVLRAPFGWYKRFEIACKGHPFSELSRRVTPDRNENSGDDERSDWIVWFPDGSRLPVTDARAKFSEGMEAFIERRTEESTSSSTADTSALAASVGGQRPPLDRMREMEFVDVDPLSEGGQLRLYPRGKLVRDTLDEYVTDLLLEYGAMPVGTPDAYDRREQPVAEHAGALDGDRSRTKSDRSQLRFHFAACVGQCSTLRDMDLSSDDLPVGLFESSKKLPVVHTVIRDMEQARDELLEQTALAVRIGEHLGISYEPIVRVTREFYDGYEPWLEQVVGELATVVADDSAGASSHVPIEIVPDRRGYWSARVDLVAVDGDLPISQRPIPTVQLDLGSADRFDIEYADETGSRRPHVLHSSPTGRIESVMAAVFARAEAMDTPRLPTWLSPTHVRLVPIVPDDHLAYCDELADVLEGSNVRVEVDDRNEPVGKRIDDAEADWVPYYAVVGDDELGEFAPGIDGNDELQEAVLGVTVRAEDREVETTIEELRECIQGDVDGLPGKRRYLPRYVSNHPTFGG